MDTKRYLVLIVLVLMLAVVMSGCASGGGVKQSGHSPTEITQTNYGLTIGASYEQSGVITSLIDSSGFQYVDDGYRHPLGQGRDRGRAIQTAVTYDGRGEEINPTMAGSSSVHDNKSEVINFHTEGDTIVSNVRAAYWNPYNGKKISDTYMYQKVRIIDRHIVRFDTRIVTEKGFRVMIAEILTAYVNPQMIEVHRLNGERGTYSFQESGSVVMMSTPDGSKAMAMYSPDLNPNASLGNGGGVLDDGRAPKMNLVTRNNISSGGDESYQTTEYVVVGTLDEVRSVVNRLKNGG